MLYDHPDFDHHAIHFHQDKTTGLKAIVAIHAAFENPSLGGCRMRDYASEADALKDVLRLSRGMTYKSVMAGLDYGGAKAVILGTPRPEVRDDLLMSMADFVNRLGGRYRTAVDVGLTTRDVTLMSERSAYVLGAGAIVPEEWTAQGVLTAVKAAVRFKLGRDDLRGLSVSILGLGKVGSRLAELLIGEGADVFGADVEELQVIAARSRGVTIVSLEQAARLPCDVFAPCALGGVLNEQTIPELRCAIVAGAANNQLASAQDAERLAARGILYAPDYIVNAGGLISIAMQMGTESEAWARAKIAELGTTLFTVFEAAQANGSNPHFAAEQIANGRIARLSRRP
jgi:leucine dehydrogenase